MISATATSALALNAHDHAPEVRGDAGGVTSNSVSLCQAASQCGDYEAFAELFESYKDKVYSIALRFSGDATAAADIAQETFLKLFSSLQDFRGEASFDSWLYRMVVNACMDHHRRARRWLPFPELNSLVAAMPWSSQKETALDDLLRAEVQAQVRETIAKLPADLRVVVILRYTEALAYDSIAEIVGCPAGTVASRLNRAHKILERRLGHLRKGLS